MRCRVIRLTILVGLTAVGLTVMLMTGCAATVPGRTIVMKNGVRYPCRYGVQLDSHYRCRGEDSPSWAPSIVERIEP